MRKTIFIDGHRVGYQFNKKSMGARTVDVVVYERDGKQFCRSFGLLLLVQPMSCGSVTSKHVFEAVAQIAQESGKEIMIDPQVERAIESVRHYLRDQGVTQQFHPINAARELSTLSIHLTPEQGEAFLQAWDSSGQGRDER